MHDGHGSWDGPALGANYVAPETGRYHVRFGGIRREEGRRFLLACDLDETLVGDAGGLAAFAQWWRRSALPRGARLAYATGRTLSLYERLAREHPELPRPDALIVAVGTEVYCVPGTLNVLAKATEDDAAQQGGTGAGARAGARAKAGAGAGAGVGASASSSNRASSSAHSSTSTDGRGRSNGGASATADAVSSSSSFPSPSASGSSSPRYGNLRPLPSPLPPAATWARDESWDVKVTSGWDVAKARDAAYAARAAAPGGAVHFRPPEEQNERKVTLGVRADALEVTLKVLKANLKNSGISYRVVVSGLGDWRFVDTLPANAGKAAALAHVAAALGFAPADVVAAGDGGNDVDMLATASRGIVVANAQPELLAWKKSRGGSDAVLANAPRAWGVLAGLEQLGLAHDVPQLPKKK